MKANEFENILDECLEQILTRGETIEQCLARYPEQAAELEPLLRTVLVSKKAISIEPRPEFREKARRQFQSTLQEIAQKKERRFAFFNRQPQWAMTIIGIIILLVASGGTVMAAGNSMPDSALYPVKLAAENLRLKLTPSTPGKVEFYTRMIDRRVDEIVRMADKDKPKQVERATLKLNSHLIAMANLTSSVMEETTPEEPAMLMAPAPEAATAEMPAPPAEKESRAAIAPAPETAPPEAPAPPGQAKQGRREGRGKGAEISKRAKLKGIISRNANENSAALRAVLERVPESVKPALRRAIAITDAGYREALRALE